MGETTRCLRRICRSLGARLRANPPSRAALSERSTISELPRGREAGRVCVPFAELVRTKTGVWTCAAPAVVKRTLRDTPGRPIGVGVESRPVTFCEVRLSDSSDPGRSAHLAGTPATGGFGGREALCHYPSI